MTNSSIPPITFSPALPIPDYLVGEIRSKLAYVDESIEKAEIISEDSSGTQSIILHLQGDPLTPERRTEIQEKVQRVIISMAKGAIKPKIQVLEDHLDRVSEYTTHPYQQDPMQELFQRGEISQEATGIYTLGPLLSRLIAFFEKHFLDLGDSFGAIPYRFPTLIPAAYLERVGYFKAFPHSLTFATHLRPDLDAIDHFAQHACCDEHGLNVAPESMDRIQAMLSPAVCYHLYFSLADRTLPSEQIIATAVGNCFRYEAINLVSLERLWNFTMREVIFMGSKDFVLQSRELARQRMEKVFAQIGLAYRVESANDPFFIGEFRKQAAFQSAFQLKFEIRAALPFKGSTLAVGSYNYHQDFFGRALNITLPEGGAGTPGAPAHTGCVAFGLERVAFAFLAQYGLDSANWPPYVRQNFDPSDDSSTLLQ